MRARIAIGALLMAAAGPAAAQLMPPLPAPARAPLREYGWTEAFPVTPPFALWTQAGRSPDETTRIWLHGDSLHWRSDRWLSVDALTYSSATADSAGGYVRYWVTFSCDAQRILLIQAYATVVVDPEGAIRPISPVSEGGVNRAATLSGSLYDQLCFDEAFRAPYMAG